MSDYRIGIDVGGTKIEGILLGSDGKELYRSRIPSAAAHGYNAMVEATMGIITEIARRVPTGSDYTVGIGIPGSLHPETGLVQNANSTCLIGKPFKSDLEKIIGRSLAMRNDADCFTLAECKMGAGQGFELVFGVIMGTGCGGGIAINGLVLEGKQRIRGEWGHFPVDPQGAKCYCGNVGCVETKISGSGVEGEFFRRHGRSLSMEEIIAGARLGDLQCRKTFDQFLDDFGRCLGGLISILDPDVVVLGGGLSNIDELYSVGIEQVRKYVFHDSLTTAILKNRLGDSAGVFGAAWIGI